MEQGGTQIVFILIKATGKAGQSENIKEQSTVRCFYAEVSKVYRLKILHGAVWTFKVRMYSNANYFTVVYSKIFE